MQFGVKLGNIFCNIGLLFLVQVCGYLIPIFEIPILGRALGVKAYGNVVLVQAVALLASLIVDYGFTLSASRQIALARLDKVSITRVYGEVLSAKLIFLVPVMLAAALSLRWASDIELMSLWVVFGVVYFFAFSFSPIWLFQGVERLGAVITIEVLLKFAGLFLLMVYVGSEQDVFFALCIMAGCGLLNTMISNVLCRQWVTSIQLTFSGGIAQIRAGFHVFIYKSSSNILLSSGPALAGLAGGQMAVGAYIPAEKIVKGCVGLIAPVLIGVFPYLSRTLAGSGGVDLKLPMFMSMAIFLMGAICTTTLFFWGEQIVLVALGSDFVGASSVLMIFALIIPFRMANQALGLSILIPLGEDKFISTQTIFFSLISVVMALFMYVPYGVSGLVGSFVVAEVFLSVSLVHKILKIRLHNRSQYCSGPK